MGTDFAILGELEVLQDGDPIELGSPRQRSLLARLLINPNETISADRLVEDLWQGEPPQSARHTLHVYVSRLRKALGRDAAKLEHKASGYVFHIEKSELDASRFETLASEGRAALARHDADAACRVLGEALDLWRGPAFSEIADNAFARAEAIRLDELRLDTTEQRMWAELECGRHQEVIGDLRDLVAQHPLREVFWEQLMLALYRTGRQADALRAFQSARTILAEELGIEPGPALHRMEDRILSQDPSIGWPRRPEGESAQSLLPLQRTSFIGRDAELERVRELMGSSRLLTLTGAPGSGKTRLALQVAADCRADFPHGTFFVPLAPVGEHRLMIETVAGSLDLREVAGETRLDSVKAFFRHRTALLVLDNFEHILLAAPEVGQLLDAAPDLRILVTSRAPLGITGEHVFPVPPLAVPPADRYQNPLAVAQYDAVALFVARAQAARPDFVLTDQNSATVAEITKHLDGLPLAIELAAARINLLTPTELLDRLIRQLPLLTGGPSDAGSRHRTMHNAIEWSYKLLEPEHQVLFRRVGVFMGGFTLEAVAAVAEVTEMNALGGVDALLSGSLLHRPADVGRARYEMLEMVREYALGELEAAGESEEIADRHARYYDGVAAQLEPLLTHDPHGSGGRQLEAEVGNLRAALLHTLESSDPDLGLSLAHHVWRFWQASNRIAEGRSWVERLLAHPGAGDASRALGLTAIAGLAYWQADYQEALSRYAQALELYQALGDSLNEADTLYSMSFSASLQGDLESGQRFADEALLAFEHLGSEEGIARVTVAQGYVRLRRGDFEAAYTVYADAHAMAEQLGDQHFATTLLPGIAACAFRLGNRDEALALSMQATEEAIEAENPSLAIWMLDLIAAISADRFPIEATRLAGAAACLHDAAGGGWLVEVLGIANARTIAEELLSPEDLERAWEAGSTIQIEEAVAQARELSVVTSQD